MSREDGSDDGRGEGELGDKGRRPPAAAVAALAIPEESVAMAADTCRRECRWLDTPLGSRLPTDRPNPVADPVVTAVAAAASVRRTAEVARSCSNTNEGRILEVWTRDARAAWACRRLHRNSSALRRSMALR